MKMVARRFDDDQAARLRAEYEAGATIERLAKEHSTSPITVRTTLARTGTTLRKRGGRPKPFTATEIREVVSRYEAGESQERIAVAMGTSQVRISRMLRSEGVVTRRGHAHGQRHPLWKGGRIVVHGYVNVYLDNSDPFFVMANSQGYVLEHRLVMARELGRTLGRSETVHHINGDKTDNRVENLQLRSGRHGKHAAFQCADCGSYNVVPTRLL